MGERNDSKQVQMTKDLLRATLLEILKKKDIDKITVTEICEKAEVNRSTFYAYFPNPMQLMISIRAEIIKRVHHIYDSYENLPLERRAYRSAVDSLEMISREFNQIYVLSKYAVTALALPIEIVTIIFEPYIESRITFPIEAAKKQHLKSFCLYGLVGIVREWKSFPTPGFAAETVRDAMTLLNYQLMPRK